MPEINTGDTAWLLASSALVLLMTPGLAFFYGGLVRRKNVLSTIMHSFIAMGVVGVVWVLWGYSLAFSDGGNNFIGDLRYIGLQDVSAVAPGSADAGYFPQNMPHMTYMIFQAMFAIITPALITGAIAERFKWSTYIVFLVLWLTVVYAPMAHWVWGGGWMFDKGVKDFAGGAVVHMNSGVAALAAALFVGRRLRHKAEPMDAHNVPFVVLGAGLLWFGWFGFNSGSALAAGGQATLAFVTTNTAAAMATITWVALSMWFSKKASAVGAASGAVAGLVAITPAAGFVGVMPAILIGMGAGAFCYFAVQFRSKTNIDDALDVFSVHGIGGTWGALATGLFVGVGTAGAYSFAGMGRGEQIGWQLVSIGVTWAWSFVLTSAILFALDKTMGLRVKEDEEEKGLDIALHGEEAYR
jgi:Amt family ammonium transporter